MYLYLVAFTFSYLKAMSIIAKLSFWILQSPKKEESIITELSFEDSVQGGLDQFRREGHVKKLKTSILESPCILTKIIYLNFCPIRLSIPNGMCFIFSLQCLISAT